MKKALSLVAGVALVTVLFTSCKKDYTCTCIIAGASTPTVFEKVSKKDATDACNQLNATWALISGSCKLD